MEKRYQYWGGDGNINWTDWFPWDSTLDDKIQLKGFKGNNLLNEYR